MACIGAFGKREPNDEFLCAFDSLICKLLILI